MSGQGGPKATKRPGRFLLVMAACILVAGTLAPWLLAEQGFGGRTGLLVGIALVAAGTTLLLSAIRKRAPFRAEHTGCSPLRSTARHKPVIVPLADAEYHDIDQALGDYADTGDPGVMALPLSMVRAVDPESARRLQRAVDAEPDADGDMVPNSTLLAATAAARIALFAVIPLWFAHLGGAGTSVLIVTFLALGAAVYTLQFNRAGTSRGFDLALGLGGLATVALGFLLVATTEQIPITSPQLWPAWGVVALAGLLSLLVAARTKRPARLLRVVGSIESSFRYAGKELGRRSLRRLLIAILVMTGGGIVLALTRTTPPPSSVTAALLLAWLIHPVAITGALALHEPKARRRARAAKDARIARVRRAAGGSP